MPVSPERRTSDCFLYFIYFVFYNIFISNNKKLNISNIISFKAIKEQMITDEGSCSLTIFKIKIVSLWQVYLTELLSEQFLLAIIKIIISYYC